MTLAETMLKQLENHALSRDERAQLQCQIAADFEHRGQYDAARETLGELWNGVGKRPREDSFRFDACFGELHLTELGSLFNSYVELTFDRRSGKMGKQRQKAPQDWR
jgi:hypothetical protein